MKNSKRAWALLFLSAVACEITVLSPGIDIPTMDGGSSDGLDGLDGSDGNTDGNGSGGFSSGGGSTGFAGAPDSLTEDDVGGSSGAAGSAGAENTGGDSNGGTP